MLSALTGLSLGTAPATAEPEYQQYVALGDSFTSAPLVPEMRLDPLLCMRSTNNYPTLLAGEIKPAEFTDVSCAAADTTHMTTTQSGASGPQFDALDEDTDLVTLGIAKWSRHGDPVGSVSRRLVQVEMISRKTLRSLPPQPTRCALRRRRPRSPIPQIVDQLSQSGSSLGKPATADGHGVIMVAAGSAEAVALSAI
ncbi:hypothetical protein AB0H34_33785 [Saccharopolyspora shandongensis]|uniref:hypothetical protein n=1 Tax=Saccharopolyspora shandongensis TaxID=418495 RepID=UPI0033EE29DF